jgi:hypothetical protein
MERPFMPKTDVLPTPTQLVSLRPSLVPPDAAPVAPDETVEPSAGLKAWVSTCTIYLPRACIDNIEETVFFYENRAVRTGFTDVLEETEEVESVDGLRAVEVVVAFTTGQGVFGALGRRR